MSISGNAQPKAGSASSSKSGSLNGSRSGTTPACGFLGFAEGYTSIHWRSNIDPTPATNREWGRYLSWGFQCNLGISSKPQAGVVPGDKITMIQERDREILTRMLRAAVPVDGAGRAVLFQRDGEHVMSRPGYCQLRMICPREGKKISEPVKSTQKVTQTGTQRG